MHGSLIAQINGIWIQFVHQDLSIHISDRINIITIHHETFLQFIPCISDISNLSAINQWILEHISTSNSCIITIFSNYETDGLPNLTLNEIDCLNHCRYGISMLNTRCMLKENQHWRMNLVSHLDIQSTPICVFLTTPALTRCIDQSASIFMPSYCAQG